MCGKFTSFGCSKDEGTVRTVWINILQSQKYSREGFRVYIRRNSTSNVVSVSEMDVSLWGPRGTFGKIETEVSRVWLMNLIFNEFLPTSRVIEQRRAILNTHEFLTLIFHRVFVKYNTFYKIQEKKIYLLFYRMFRISRKKLYDLVFITIPANINCFWGISFAPQSI